MKSIEEIKKEEERINEEDLEIKKGLKKLNLKLKSEQWLYLNPAKEKEGIHLKIFQKNSKQIKIKLKF